MMPIISITVVPAALILAVAYVLRPQGGRQRPHPMPADRILTRLATDTQPMPVGDPRHPSFTVQTRRRWSAE